MRLKTLNTAQWAILLAWLIAALSFGSTWFLNRATFAPGGFTSYTAAALRFDIAAIIALLICLATNRTCCFNRRMLWLNCLAAISFAAVYIGIYIAAKDILGGLAATILSLSGVVMLALSALLGLEKIARRAWIGTLLCLVGTGTLFLNKTSLSFTHGLTVQGTAVLIMVGAAAANGVGNIILRKKKASDDSFASTTILLSAVGVLLSLFAEFMQPGTALPALAELHFQPVMAVLGQVISTLCAFTAVIYLSTRVSAPTLASLAFVTPLVAITIDRLFERPELWMVNYTWITLVGAGLILLGLVPITWKKKTKVVDS